MAKRIDGIPVPPQSDVLQGMKAGKGVGGPKVMQLATEDVPLPVNHVGNRGWHRADVHDFNGPEGGHMGAEPIHPGTNIQVALGISAKNFPRHQQVLVKILALGLAGWGPPIVKKIRSHLGDRKSFFRPGRLCTVAAIIFPKYGETPQGVAELFWIPANEPVKVQA